MTPDQAARVRDGLEIAVAYLRGDGDGLDTALEPHLSEDGFPRMVECFVQAGVLAVDVVAKGGERMPVGAAFDEVAPREEVVLLDGLPVGPWAEITALARAYAEGGDAAARQVPMTMDLPGAINASFRFCVSALVAVTGVPEFAHLGPADVAELFIGGIDDGSATAGPDPG